MKKRDTWFITCIISHIVPIIKKKKKECSTHLELDFGSIKLSDSQWTLNLHNITIKDGVTGSDIASLKKDIYIYIYILFLWHGST